MMVRLAEEMAVLPGFSIAEWIDPPCPAEGPMPVAPLHLHRECDEAWIVLEGRLIVQVGDEEVECLPGACVGVPRGTPHTYWNPDPVPAKYLLVMMEKTRRLIEALHQPGDLTYAQIFEAHDAELLA
ncbi:hypothetical protein BH11ARM1_BH11ARM1_18480 [soil metagenome]